MNKFMLLPAILLAVAGLSWHAGEPDKIKGYFINNNGDTNYVTFNLKHGILRNKPGKPGIQGGIKYLTPDGETTLTPYDAKGFSFTYDNVLYRYFSMSTAWNPMATKMFLELEADGFCKLLKYYDTDQRNGSIVMYYVFGKGESETYQYSVLSRLPFSEKLSDYFFDCEAVLKFLKSKKIREDDCPQIASIYNTSCARR